MRMGKSGWKKHFIGLLFIASWMISTATWADPPKDGQPATAPATSSQPRPQPQPQQPVQPAAPQPDQTRRFDAPPLHWATLARSLELTRELIDNPNLTKDERGARVRSIRQFNGLIADNKAESLAVLQYLAGSAFNNPDARRVLDNLEYIQAQAGVENETIKEITDRARFRQMMGAIGQDARANRARFDLFLTVAAQEADRGNQWLEKFKDVIGKIEVYDDQYHHRMRWYRRGAKVVTGLGAAVGALPGAINLFNHGHGTIGNIGPDLQVMGGGLLGMWLGDKAGGQIDAWGHGRVQLSMQDQSKAIMDGYEMLFAMDPERTAPHLIANVIDGLENPNSKVLGELSYKLLMKTAGANADKSLVTLGILMLKSGEGEKAREIFEELSKRDPHGPYGKMWPEMRDSLDKVKATDKNFTNMKARLGWKKIGLAALPVAGMVWTALHTLNPEELATAVVVVRDLAIGEASTHWGEKFFKKLTSGRVGEAMTHATEELTKKFQKLTTAGDAGFDILTALAENKVPGKLGEVLAEAATRVLRKNEGFGAAHMLARLNPRNGNRQTPGQRLETAEAQIGAQQRTLGALCKMDYSHLAKPRGRNVR